MEGLGDEEELEEEVQVLFGAIFSQIFSLFDYFHIRVRLTKSLPS